MASKPLARHFPSRGGRKVYLTEMGSIASRIGGRVTIFSNTHERMKDLFLSGYRYSS
ncbi:MAG: hypothetical protein NTZ74_04420 [Chloroflexi bacterium]|nr:hypothetical protein [Chloroflexota bacterium]